MYQFIHLMKDTVILPILTITNKAAVNIHVHFIVQK